MGEGRGRDPAGSERVGTVGHPGGGGRGWAVGGEHGRGRGGVDRVRDGVRCRPQERGCVRGREHGAEAVLTDRQRAGGDGRHPAGDAHGGAKGGCIVEELDGTGGRRRHHGGGGGGRRPHRLRGGGRGWRGCGGGLGGGGGGR